MKDFAPAAANMDGADQDAYVADALTTECVNFIKQLEPSDDAVLLQYFLIHQEVIYTFLDSFCYQLSTCHSNKSFIHCTEYGCYNNVCYTKFFVIQTHNLGNMENESHLFL